MTDAPPRGGNFAPSELSEWLLALIAVVALAGGVLFEWVRIWH